MEAGASLNRMRPLCMPAYEAWGDESRTKGCGGTQYLQTNCIWNVVHTK